MAFAAAQFNNLAPGKHQAGGENRNSHLPEVQGS